MNSSALLESAGITGAELCPHPAARQASAIAVRGRRGQPMIFCHTCYETLQATARSWHAYAIRPSTVFRRLRMLEYSRRDALRFVVQLIADRAQIRLGILKRSQVDV